VDTRRVPALLLVLALLLTACGARLSEDQREFAVGSGGQAGATGQQAVGGQGGGEGGDDEFAMPEVGDPGSGGAEGGSDAAGGSGGSGGGGGGSDGGGRGSDGGGGDGGGGEAGGASGGSEDWRSVPEGGNGGATDVGVTEEAVTIANVSDISGAVPGIFEDAQLAAAAYAAYHNASEGPIYGRQIEFLPLDSRLDSGQNRQQYLRACDEAFAAAGSMSAFEEGAADPVAGCGIPDLRSVATSQPMQQLDTVYSTQVQEPGTVVTAEYKYWMEQHPQAVKNAGVLFLENETTRFQTGQNRRAMEQLGYEFVYMQSVQVAETNYNGFVLDMADAGVEFLTFQGDYSQAVRLANAMRQQNFWPEVFALQTNIYTPDFLASGGSAVEGTQIAVGTVLLEEIDRHEELQLYREWLKQVDPSAEPTSLGMLAWSAMSLFAEGLKEIGPEPTREAMLEFLDGVRDWEGGGLHPPAQIGPKTLTSCVVIVEVQGGAFERVEPADEGFLCDETVKLR
jgi:ABC-type branched-subunit amino acid transport system substrate-binding protein